MMAMKGCATCAWALVGKDNTVSGFVDALRFSKGVLSTNEFMRLETRGTTVLIR